MEENFNPVARTRANYYTPGSPVQFVCVELLKGDVSGEHAVCLTFKNISKVTLTALEIHFKCKGVDGVIGTLALVITENNNIRTICRQTIRYSHFYFNSIDWIFVFINQFSPEFSTNLLFRIAIIFYMVIRRNICDFLLAFFSNNMCITIFYCSFEICHLSSS